MPRGVTFRREYACALPAGALYCTLCFRRKCVADHHPTQPKLPPGFLEVTRVEGFLEVPCKPGMSSRS